jgi:hypothetical protein
LVLILNVVVKKDVKTIEGKDKGRGKNLKIDSSSFLFQLSACVLAAEDLAEVP